MSRSQTFMIVTALLATIAIAFACGGDDDNAGNALTLEQYFAEFESIDARANSEAEELFAIFPGGPDISEEEFYADEDNLPFLKEILGGLPGVVENAIEGFEALDAPDEVADAHDEMLAAANEMLAAFENDAKAAADAESMEEAVVASQGDESLRASASFENACLAVVEIADAQGIETNITCLQGSS